MAFVFALVALPAAAQNPLWIDQLGTSSLDMALAATPDGSGGAYVGGVTHGSLGAAKAGGADVWLARFDGAGSQRWIRQLGTSADDHAAGAAPDDAGGVYVTGSSAGSLGGPNAGSGDAWLARYDGAGSPLWIRQLGTSQYDEATAAAQDGAGGVYVAGYTDGSLGGSTAGGVDAWVARYDGNGKRIWVRQLGTSAWDLAFAASPDGSGGVYVSGDSPVLAGPSMGGTDTWVAHYDGAGMLIWTRKLGSTEAEFVYASAPDGSGGVYLSGVTNGSLGGASAGASDTWLARFDGAGNELWVRQLGTSQQDEARSAAPDGSGGVYVSGRTLGSLGGSQADGYDVWVAHYDGAGNLLQMHQFGTDSDDAALAAASDASGGVILSGSTYGDLNGLNAGGADIWIGRFEPCSATTYCIGAVNSTGQGASIGHQGSTSIAQNDLVLSVQGCPPFQPGIFFFGQFQTQVAFGDGFLCATGQQKRLPAVFVDASGAGSFQVDFTDPNSPASTIQPGDARNFQFWYRDPQPVGNGFNLSDGLAAIFCP